MQSKFLNTVWIPLVVKNSTKGCEEFVSTLEPLSLEGLQHPPEYRRDFIHFNYNVDPESDMMYQQAYDALFSAKNIIASRLSTFEKVERNYKFHYTFPQKNYYYTGDSLGLGMALLDICLLSQMSAYKDIYKFREPVACTGIVDIKGHVRPINPESLALKIRTFYFSPFEQLLIPEDNLNDAKKR